MEFMALFIWLCLCVLMGGVMHYVMSGPLRHRPVQLLAAPGMIIRKFTMTLVALLTGATVTRVRIYELDSQDITFEAEGMSGIAKALVPLAPLFGSAFVLIALNGLFGSPLELNYTPPSLEALDSGSLKGFCLGTWALLSDAVEQAVRADWGNQRLYVLFALVFSMALGGCAPMRRVKEAALGAALLAVGMALMGAVAARRGAAGVGIEPAWFMGVKQVVVRASAAAFVMMVYGLLCAVVVGLAVRVYELFVGAPRSDEGSTRKLPEADSKRRAA
jgi:hypothetical protein